MAEPGGTAWSAVLRVGTVVAITSIASARCLTLASGNPWFDLDPAISGELPSVMTPAASVFLDGLLLLLCALGLHAEARSGRGMHWWLLIAAALPVIPLLVHGGTDAMQWWHGASWLGAMLAAVTLAHLCRGGRNAVLAAAVLFAIASPLLVREAVQFLIEHPETVQYFEEHRAEVFAMNGLLDGTSPAVVFEERLRAPGSAAWFSSPNILAAVLAASCAAWIGLALAARRRMDSGWWFLAAIIAVACGIGVLATMSKAGIVTLAVALALLSIAAMPHIRRWLGTAGGGFAIAIVAVAVLVVVARGLLPVDFMGERSLMIRAEYVQGAMEIAVSNPVLGTGAAGFPEAWLQVRPPSAAEAVTSTHNVVLDWLAMFGVFGVAWVACAGVLLWRAGRAVGRREERGVSCNRGLIAASSVMAVVAAVIIGGPLEAWSVVGLGGMAALVFVTAMVACRGRERWWLSGLGTAAIVVALDAEVDMVLFDTAAVSWGLCVLGVGGALPRCRPRGVDKVAWVVPLALAGCVLLLALPPLARESVRQHAAAVILVERGVAGRGEAVDLLTEEGASFESRMAAVEQLLAAREYGGVWSVLEPMPRHSAVRRIQASVAPTIEESIAAARDLVRMDPNGLRAHLLLADALVAGGHKEDAASVYGRVLLLNDARKGDPSRQLSNAEWSRVTGLAGLLVEQD
ncbi:MAG: O-antigen ligase family protein [Phycisphaerales bacterium]|nr:O-antigen ligase family protein [Phycisphaerales bacterium]